MSKELKALRMLEQVCLVANVANMEEQINIIEDALKALEIIKDWLNLKVVELLPNNSDTRLFVECGRFKVGISIPPAYIDLLKEVLKNE